MTSSRWLAAIKVFETALEVPKPERSSFVEQACAGDRELETEVRKLLSADEQAGHFLEEPLFPNCHESAACLAEPPRFPEGTIISDRFQIVRFIGRGGMGQVYEALDLELKAKIAVKMLRSDISSDPQALLRFRREVQLTRLITHPNVCRTFDIERYSPTEFDPITEIVFMTMELLEGETLATLLRRVGRMSTEDALPLVLQMIEALSAAHAIGVIHRDFKPSNVLLVQADTRMRLVVTDFGLARAILPDAQASGGRNLTSVTGNQELMGTLPYMAPEQLERGEASVASDIYSLGLVIFEMVTGQRPFVDPIPFAEATKRLKQDAPLANAIVPELDSTWSETICRCLELHPKNRFQHVGEVQESIVAGGRDDTLKATSHTVTFPSRLTGRRTQDSQTLRRWRLALLPIFVVTVSLFAVLLRHYLWGHNPPRIAERDWILVTDFANQTGERVFDRVVRDLAVQSLSQSNYFNIVPRLTALEAARRTGAMEINTIDERLGRELCLRENYRGFLTGEIAKDNAAYVVTMRVIVPGEDNATFTGAERIQSPDELFGAIDHLTARIRRSLGESFARIQSTNKVLAQVTTPSLEALQRYSTAADLYDSWEYVRCINLAKDAVERDPNFAMAHLLLARAYEQMGDEQKFKDELHLAVERSDRVSERERHLILAASYSSRMLNERAADEYQHLLDIFPDDIDGLKGYAWEAFWSGHSDQALVAQRKVLTHSPDNADAYDALMSLLVRTDHFSEALAIYDQARLHKLQGANLTYMAALASWGAGDLTRTRDLFESLSSNGSMYWKILSRLSVGKLLAFQGRMAEALEIFRTGMALVRMPGFENWLPVFDFQIVRAEILLGDTPAARVECKHYLRAAERAPIAMNLERGADLFIQMGDLRGARHFQQLARLKAAESPDPFSEMETHALSAAIELASHNLKRAVEESRSSLTFRIWYTPYLMLGKACESEANWDCAIKAYIQYLDFKGTILSSDAPEDWVIAHYLLARTYFESGDVTDGEASYGEFLTLFENADQGLPILSTAKREIEHWRHHISSTERQTLNRPRL